MPAPRTYYDILNVAPEAELVVIEAAYRALMKKYHPDQGPSGSEGGSSAADINNAFAVLRDPQRRAQYDHREWTRTQSLQLVQYHQYQLAPPVPRRLTVFGWSGWLVSALLAAALAVVAGHSGGIAPLPRVEALEAAKMSVPNFRSQPIAPEESLVSSAEAARIRAEAYAPRPLASAKPSEMYVPPAAAAPAPRPRLAARARAGRSRRAEKDFVERHGGIY